MAKNLKEEVIKILLENKLLTRQQLEEALKIQKQKQGKLRDILISLKFVKNDDLMAALSESSGIPLISLDKLRIDKEIVKLIPEELARRYVLIAVSKISNTLTIAMSDPLNIFAIDDLKALTRFVIHPIISSEEEILSALDRYYGQGGKLESLLREGDESLLKDVKASSDGKVQDADTLLKMMGEKPVIRLTNLILTEAVRRAASDVLIEPQEKKTTVRYRVDGILQESPTVPKALHSAIISRIKVMSNLNIAEHRLPQDGRFKVRVLKREVDYRVSVLPSSFGEKIALRVLDKSSSTLDINKLGFEEQVLERIASLEGMVKHIESVKKRLA